MKGRERKAREGKGREGKGKEGRGREGKGFSILFTLSGFFALWPCLGWKLFSAGSPDRMFLTFWKILAIGYVGWKLFSASSLAFVHIFAFLFTAICARRQWFSAGSPAMQHGQIWFHLLIQLFDFA